MSSLVAVAGVDAGTDEGHFGGPARSPIGAAIAAIVGVDVGSQFDSALFGEVAKAVGEVLAVGAGAVGSAN